MISKVWFIAGAASKIHVQGVRYPKKIEAMTVAKHINARQPSDGACIQRRGACGLAFLVQG
jgi:hypothetical protein